MSAPASHHDSADYDLADRDSDKRDSAESACVADAAGNDASVAVGSPTAAPAGDPFDLSTFDLAGLSDEQLRALASDIGLEQHLRALDQADPDALVELGFAEGFPRGNVRDPWIEGQVLICPGQLTPKSKQSHDCTFVSVKQPFDDTSRWVWEASDLVGDGVRFLPGSQAVQRSISLLAAIEGLCIDVVVSQARQGRHTMKQARSYTITDGKLVHVSTRARKPSSGHR